jgi:hypothetical protein
VAGDARLLWEVESFARFEPRLQKVEIEEDTRMRTSAITIWLAATLATAHVSIAQQSPEAPRTPATTISEAELDTFATIYADLLATAAKFDAEIESAQTDQQALEIRERAQAESVAKVAQRGWTPEKFNSVGEAINSDPALTERAVKLIEAK